MESGRQYLATACLIGLASLAACGNGASPVAPPPPDNVSVTDPPLLYSSTRSGITDELRTVIRDPAAWQLLWDQLIHGGVDAAPPLPAVDFTTSVVVVAAMGARERGGFSITIPAWERTGNAARVTVLSTTPPGDCPSSPVITTPAVAVAVASSPTITFVELSEEAACPLS